MRNIIKRIKLNLYDILFYSIPFSIGVVYWLAFYPGVLSFDSVLQWDQLSTLTITDVHPAFHTILMWLLTRIWYSPAMISLFQVIFASLVIGYGLHSLRNASSLPARLFIALGILISANPLVGIMNVTLWKDVLFGFLLLLLTIYLFNMINTKGEWISPPLHFILLGCVLAFTWLIRFNGFPIVLVFLISTLLIYKKYFRQLLFSSLIAISLILLIQGPLYDLFKVNKELHYSYGIAFIHPVVAYINQKPDTALLTTTEKGYLDQIYPLSKQWPYSCYDATIFFYNNANLMPVMKNPLLVVKIFSKLAINDPGILFKHYLCLSSFVWQPNQPSNVYLETILFDNYNLSQTPSWTKYQDLVTQNQLLPQVHRLIERAVKAEWSRDTSMLLWRPALYMFGFLIGLILLVGRTRRLKWLLLSAPVVTQSIIMMFTAQLQALRYQYPVYLISMLFTIPLILVAWKYPSQLSNC